VPNLISHVKGRTLADAFVGWVMRETFVHEKKAVMGNRRWARSEECHDV
jgi:hypothetical protein